MNRTVMMSLFGLVGTTVAGLLHYYLWTRLVRDPRMPAPYDKVATVALVVLALFIPSAMVLTRALSPSVGRALAYPAFVWMGVMFILFMVFVAVDAVKALSLLGLKLFSRDDLLQDPERRQLLASATAVAGAATAGVLSTFALRRTSEGASVKTVEVTMPKLPAAMDGLTVAQLTDIHFGPTIGRDYAQMLVEKTNAFNPDIICITGDLVDGNTEDLGACVAELSRLKARHGVFFVTGNHEYFSGADEWIAFVRAQGMRVLRNERVEIVENGATLDLAGVDDFNAERFGNGHGQDITAAMKGRNADRPLLMLAHQPRAIEEAAPQGVDLMLSGHTHGGQIWPWNFAVKLQQPYVEGLYNHQGSQLYVSPGTGYWGPPMRLGTRAEITRLVLRSQDRQA